MCGTDQRARRSLVHRCLTHGILLAHPKKFARALHDRTFKECEAYGAHVRSHLDTEELATYDHTAELVMFRVFSILVGVRTTQAMISRARQDEQAMKVGWFSELVESSGQEPWLCCCSQDPGTEGPTGTFPTGGQDLVLGCWLGGDVVHVRNYQHQFLIELQPPNDL